MDSFFHDSLILNFALQESVLLDSSFLYRGFSASGSSDPGFSDPGFSDPGTLHSFNYFILDSLFPDNLILNAALLILYSNLQSPILGSLVLYFMVIVYGPKI